MWQAELQFFLTLQSALMAIAVLIFLVALLWAAVYSIAHFIDKKWK